VSSAVVFCALTENSDVPFDNIRKHSLRKNDPSPIRGCTRVLHDMHKKRRADERRLSSISTDDVDKYCLANGLPIAYPEEALRPTGERRYSSVSEGNVPNRNNPRRLSPIQKRSKSFSNIMSSLSDMHSKQARAKINVEVDSFRGAIHSIVNETEVKAFNLATPRELLLLRRSEEVEEEGWMAPVSPATPIGAKSRAVSLTRTSPLKLKGVQTLPLLSHYEGESIRPGNTKGYLEGLNANSKQEWRRLEPPSAGKDTRQRTPGAFTAAFMDSSISENQLGYLDGGSSQTLNARRLLASAKLDIDHGLRLAQEYSARPGACGPRAR